MLGLGAAGAFVHNDADHGGSWVVGGARVGRHHGGRHVRPSACSKEINASTGRTRRLTHDTLNTRELFEHLVAEHGYAGSYMSVLRSVRRRFGPSPEDSAMDRLAQNVHVVVKEGHSYRNPPEARRRERLTHPDQLG